MIGVLLIGIFQQDSAVLQPGHGPPDPDRGHVGGGSGAVVRRLSGKGRQGAHHGGAQRQRENAGNHVLHGNSSYL